MSYANLKNKNQRIAVTIFQIDLDKNDPAFDAEFSADLSSYDTPKTTNDIRAYKEGSIKTYSFCDTHIFGLNVFPYLISCASEPPKVNPSQDIGIRATASVSLKNFISNDSYELKGSYSNRRIEGSFWAKMFARNEFKFRDARILRGYTDDGYFHAENFQIEHYVIDQYQEPSLDGSVRFSLVDVLALTDGINVKVPTVTSGILAANLSSGATTCTFNALDTASEYGTTGYWIIGENVMQYTITSATTANITQSRFGTLPSDQAINSSIQRCLGWTNKNVIDILYDLFALTKIPASYIPTAKWNALKAGELSIFNFTALIYEPTEVKTLINELIEHCGLTMFTDTILKEITIVTSGVIANPVLTFNSTEHIQEGSFSHSNKFEKVITNQFVRWGLINYVKNENSNYSKNKRVIDIQAEDASRLRVGTSGKEIKSRWLTNSLDGNQVADQIATRKVAQFSSVPKEIKFKTDVAYIGDFLNDRRFWLGSTFQIELPENCAVNANNSKKTVVAQCVSIQPDDNGIWSITGITYNANIPPKYDYMIKAGTYKDYVLATDSEFAPILAAGGAKEYIVIVEQGALIGSTTLDAAFKQGTFPAGATLYLIVYGRILGKGGNGGNGGFADYESGVCNVGSQSTGFDGGVALELTTDCKLDVLYGLLGGGGGGGAGLPGECYPGGAKAGGGGGGGQGFVPGTGGNPGIASTGADEGIQGPNASIDAPGTGWAAFGGALGENGIPTVNHLGANISGGVAGAAIVTNGHTLDILSGNSADKIKGGVV